MRIVTPQMEENYERARVIKKADHALLVKYMDSGLMTLSEVGDIFGISRERVRQLYRKITGHSARSRIERNREIRAKEKDALLGKVFGECRACHKPLTRKNNKSVARGVYCKQCRIISFKQNRIPELMLQCINCGKDFHPNRFYYRDLFKAQTCSSKCGGEWKSKQYKLGNIKKRQRKST